MSQIAFMKSFPMGDLGQVSFALSGINIFICLIYWPVPLALYLTGHEVYAIQNMPVGMVVASWICTGSRLSITQQQHQQNIALYGEYSTTKMIN